MSISMELRREGQKGKNGVTKWVKFEVKGQPRIAENQLFLQVKRAGNSKYNWKEGKKGKDK